MPRAAGARAALPKSSRLLSHREFARVLDRPGGARVNGRNFTVVLRRGEGQARLGVVASRRVGSAVRRNRAKRLVREFFRQIKAGLEPIEMVVIVKSGASRLAAGEAAAELTRTLDRALAGMRGERAST